MRLDSGGAKSVAVYIDVIPPGGTTNPFGCLPNGRILQETQTLDSAGASQGTTDKQKNFFADTETISAQFNNVNPDTVVRTTGSWVTDGFVAGGTFTVSGTASNDGTFLIDSVTALVLTLDSGETLTNEGPLTAMFTGFIGDDKVEFSCTDHAGAVGKTYTLFAAVDVNADDLAACSPFVNNNGCFEALADDDTDDPDNGPFQRNSPRVKPPRVLALHSDLTMSETNLSPSTVDINNGQTKYFTASSGVSSADNSADWPLVLVLRDKPTVTGSADIDIWWQNGGACSTGPVAGQIFASDSVSVPVAVDRDGVTIFVTKTGGTVSHTFGAGDLLCMKFANTGTAANEDIHIYTDRSSKSGSNGNSGLVDSASLILI